MLMTRAGASTDPAFRSSGTRNLVRWKTPLTLRASTRSNAASSKSSSGAPQVAPALLTRMSRASSRDATSSARRRHSASVERSAGIPMQVPFLDSSAATASTTSAFREEMYTFTPASTKPSAIIRPMPRLPPVTSAVLPAMSKRFDAVMGLLCPPPSRRGQCERAAHRDTGAHTRGFVLDEEGGAVVHPARAVRRAAADEEVAARQVAQELA